MSKVWSCHSMQEHLLDEMEDSYIGKEGLSPKGATSPKILMHVKVCKFCNQTNTM